MHLFCSGAPPHNGCTAPYRVQCPISGAVPPCLWRLWRLSGLRGSSGLGLSSAWVVFCLGLCGASCCGSSEMSHAIPRHVFQTLKSHRWNCNVLGYCTKFGYPNCVRVLVEEAPKASSCVRSSHDTVHNPRDASNTTPTPQNAKSRFRGAPRARGRGRSAASPHARPPASDFNFDVQETGGSSDTNGGGNPLGFPPPVHRRARRVSRNSS